MSGYSVTYASLTSEIQTIVESTNSDFVAELPKIIARAHDQVQKDLSLSMWRTFEINHLSAGSPSYPRQPSWLKLISIYLVDEGKFLEPRTLDYIKLCGSARGLPRYWSERSESEFYVAPIPRDNSNVEIEVLIRLDPPSPTLAETWITKNAADLLLLQALIGAESYLQGPERVAEFIGLYKTALNSALNELNGTKRTEYEPIRSAARPL